MNSKKASVIKSTIYMILLVGKACPKKLIWQSFINFLTAIESFVFNVIFIKMIVQLLEDNSSITDILFITMFALCLKLIIGLFNSYYSIKLKPLFDIKVSKYIQNELFKKVLSLDLLQYESKDFHSKYYKAVSNAESTAETVVSNCLNLFSNAISVIAVICYISIIDPFLIIMAIIPLITTLASKISNKVRYKLNMLNMEPKRKQDYVNRIVYLREYALELRTSNIFTCLKNYYCHSSKIIKNNIDKYGFKLSLLRLISDFLLTTLTLCLSYGYIGWRFFYVNDIVISDFAVLINAINNMNFKVSNIINNIYTLQENSLYTQNLCDFFNEKPLIDKNENNTILIEPKYNKIVLKNVFYNYNSSSHYALQNISMTINRGEKIAIVGKNGSGKSTLLKILLRLYDTSSGSVEIDGHNIKNINYFNYKSLFCPVFQDYKLFAETIKNNISMGNNIDEELIRESLELVNIDKKIASLKEGIESILSKEFVDNGIVLSGGENQKIAISRAFASSSPIIILDEPTASLDVESEYKIYKNIYEQMNEKTVIFVSHRLTSTIMADKIIMMDNGKIVECGTHDELIKQKGQYYDLFSIQANAYQGVENE